MDDGLRRRDVDEGTLSGGDPSVVALISALEARSELGYLYDSFVAAQARFLLDAVENLQAQVQALVDQGHMEPEHQTGLWSILDQALVAIVNDRPAPQHR